MPPTSTCDRDKGIKKKWSPKILEHGQGLYDQQLDDLVDTPDFSYDCPVLLVFGQVAERFCGIHPFECQEHS